MLPQAESRGAPSKRPIAARRGAPRVLRRRSIGSGFERARHHLSWTCLSDVSFGLDHKFGKNALLVSDHGEIQAYCRRIVNQNKKVMAAPGRAKVVTKSDRE